MDTSDYQLNIESQTSITTTPDLFQLVGKSLYDMRHEVILVRELLQNSYDAESTRIDITCKFMSDNPSITVRDDGIGMSRDIVQNVFLMVGKTLGKDSNSIGGFGIAKVSIFSGKSFIVESVKDNIKTSVYTNEFNQLIIKSEKCRQSNGTMVRVYTEKRPDWIYSYVKESILKIVLGGEYRCKCKITLDIDSEVFRVKSYKSTRTVSLIDIASLRKASPLKHVSNFQPYDFRNTIFYRINGLVQFYNYSDSNINWIVDFQGIGYKPRDDQYPFSLSREKCKLTDRIEVEIQNRNKDKMSLEDKTGEKVKRVKINGILYFDCHPKDFNDKQRRIYNLFKVMINKVDSSKEVGYIGTPSIVGSNNGDTILINPSYFTKHDTKEELLISLWHLLIHEMSHEKQEIHNEYFTSQEGELSRDHWYTKVILDDTVTRKAKLAVS